MRQSVCFEGYMFWATIFFWIAVVAIGVMEKRKYGLSLKETLRVMVGLTKVPWTASRIIAFAAVLIVSFGIIFRGIEVCKGAV